VKNLLCVYFVVHDLNVVMLVVQVFVWNFILVTLIQRQCYGNMRVIQGGASGTATRDKGATS
jgi:hypothetical protein